MKYLFLGFFISIILSAVLFQLFMFLLDAGTNELTILAVTCVISIQLSAVVGFLVYISKKK